MEPDDQVKIRVLPDRRVSRKDAAVILGRAYKTLSDWKLKGWGPRPIIVGGRIFHDYDECIAMARGEKPIWPQVGA
jgi:hypothetical protein